MNLTKLVFIFLLCCISCAIVYGRGEPDIKNAPGFVYVRELNGSTAQLTFFESWTGYSHPVALKGAISYAQAQRLNVYNRAYFVGNSGNERFVRLEKIWLTRQLFVGDIGRELRGRGTTLYLATATGKGFDLGATTDLDGTIDTLHYFEVDLLPDAPPAEVRLVSKKIKYSYHYHYDTAGALIRVETTSGNKVNILDYR